MNDQSGKEAMSIQQWEYCSVTLAMESRFLRYTLSFDKLDSTLKLFGESGWELISTVNQMKSLYLIFKRQKPQQNDK